MAERRHIVNPPASASPSPLSEREKTLRLACEAALVALQDAATTGNKQMRHPVVGVFSDFLVMARDALKENA